jgi:hypothetical protein
VLDAARAFGQVADDFLSAKQSEWRKAH